MNIRALERVRPGTAFLALALLATQAVAQFPPVTVLWTVILPYGSMNDNPARISVDQDTTYWMLSDDGSQWSTQDGVIRSYDPNGFALQGYWPDPRTIGCNASLDHPIDLLVRNDSIWGLADWHYLSGDPSFCAVGPDYHWNPGTPTSFWDFGVAMAVRGTNQYVLSRHQDQADPGNIANQVSCVGIDGVSTWETLLPYATYGEAYDLLAVAGDSLCVVAFPLLHWIQAADGAYSSTETLYNGDAAPGRLILAGNYLNSAIYWAVNDGGTVRYGKHDIYGTTAWNGTAPDITVMALAADDQGRLWIGGSSNDEGKVIKVGADGSLEGVYTLGASVTDLDYSYGRLSFTGRWLANNPSTYLIKTIPEL